VQHITMRHQNFTAYPGRSLFDKADAYLRATDPSFARQPAAVRVHRVGEVIKGAHSPRVVARGRTAIAQLTDAINEDSFRGVFEAAIKEDPELALAVLRSLLERADNMAKGMTTASAGSGPATLRVLMGHPGRNEIEKAVGYLIARVPAFRLRDRATQVRLAGAFVRDLAHGDEHAERALTQRLSMPGDMIQQVTR
jgi:hypothetical protein